MPNSMHHRFDLGQSIAQSGPDYGPGLGIDLPVTSELINAPLLR